MNNNLVEFVTVTYNKDFDTIVGLLESMDDNIDYNFSHTIILNDDIKYYTQLKQIIDQFTNRNRNIIHYQDISLFFNDLKIIKNYNTDLDGWSVAQIILFYFSTICQFQFYIMLTSRNRISQYWNINEIFFDNKSPITLSCDSDLYWESLEPRFKIFFKNSFQYFNLDWQKYIGVSNLPSSNPPFVWRTKYVLELLDYLKKQNSTVFNCIDPYNRDRILETGCDAYVYNAWLNYKNLMDTIYFKNFYSCVYEIR